MPSGPGTYGSKMGRPPKKKKKKGGKKSNGTEAAASSEGQGHRPA